MRYQWRSRAIAKSRGLFIMATSTRLSSMAGPVAMPLCPVQSICKMRVCRQLGCVRVESNRKPGGWLLQGTVLQDVRIYDGVGVGIGYVEAGLAVGGPNAEAAGLVEVGGGAGAEGCGDISGGEVEGLDFVVVGIGYVDLAVVVGHTEAVLEAGLAAFV